MKKQPLKYRVNVIGAALVIFLCFRTYLPGMAVKLGLNSNFALWLVVCSLTLILSCLVPIAFLEKMCDFHPFLFGKKRFSPVSGAILASAMLLFVLLAFANSIFLWPLRKIGINFPRQTIENVDNFFVLMLYFVFTAVVPAVVEELFNRGMVLNLLLPYGKRFAVIASALIFTVMHTRLQSFIPVFGAGIILACVYLYTDNIYISMLLHFINNSYSFIMMYMRRNINGISYAGFAVFIIASIIFLGLWGRMYLRKKGVNYLSPLDKTEEKNAKITVLVKSPVMVLAVLCCFMVTAGQLFSDLGL